MVKKFSELRAKMSPAAQSRSAARAEAMFVDTQQQEAGKFESTTKDDVATTMNPERSATRKINE